jgi:hypothetical protein
LAKSDTVYLPELFSEAFANRISGRWLHGEFMCRFLPFCRRLSNYSVALLSIQRYRVQVNPFKVRVSSPPTWTVTVATVCWVWTVAALYAFPSALEISVWGIWNFRSYNVLSTYFLTLSILCTSVCDCFHLHHDCPPSCGKLLFYIWVQIPQLKTSRNAAKIVVGVTCFYGQACALSCILDLYNFHRKTVHFCSENYQIYSW